MKYPKSICSVISGAALFVQARAADLTITITVPDETVTAMQAAIDRNFARRPIGTKPTVEEVIREAVDRELKAARAAQEARKDKELMDKLKSLPKADQDKIVKDLQDAADKLPKPAPPNPK